MIETLQIKRIVLDGLLAPPDELSIPPTLTACPGRQTCRDHINGLLARAPVSWVQ